MDPASSPDENGPDTAADPAGPVTTTDADAAPGPDSAGRDLVAAVLYYEGSRALFGAATPAPRLGKYTLERILGAGAFGTVILGRNPDTEGEVAIKVLHSDERHRGAREAQRLQREALALAQLAHPNIVPVYDAGMAGGARYVVMRRVAGATLRAAQQGRPWRDVIDLYVAAARGLAAVHAAGLVHRDFKADNVLVGVDGQVMLADFGLTCLADAADESTDDGGRAASPSALAARLTRTGEAPGTPVYMAPEAIANTGLGRHSDLYSFAASLFEALYGVPPFAGDSLLALYLAATSEPPRARPDGSAVPVWLDAVVRAGLRADPRERPSSVDAMIADLDFRARERSEADAQARRARRKRFMAGLGVAAVCGVTLGAATMRPTDPCADPQTKIAAAWADHRDALAADAETLDEPQGAAIWQRVRALLDRHAADWAATSAAVCRATVHDATQSQELFDARVACLDQRRRVLAALVERLRPVSATSLAQGVQAAARLDPPVTCASVTRTPRPAPAQRQALVAVQELLAQARVRELSGDYPGADAASEAAVRDARVVGFAPALTEALVAHGRTRWLVHAGAAAQEALAEALDLAEENALDELGADASSLLTKVAALELHDAVRGEEWARQSRRKLTRIAAEPWRQSELLSNRGLLAFHVAGDLDLAAALHREALAARERLPGEVRLLVADSHQNLGNVLAARGALTDALAHYGESQRLNREVLGEAHPRIFDDVYNRAAALYEAGDYAQAEAVAEAALAGYLRANDAGGGDVADAHILLATILETRRQLAAALAHARLAAGILASDPEASPGKRAIAVERVGSLEREGGDLDAARRTYDQALALLGDDRNFAGERASILINRASSSADLQRFADAHRDCDLALAIADAAGPALARYRASALRARGRTFMWEERPGLARAAFEAALASLMNVQDPPMRAEVKYLLARTLIETDGDRQRAVALARESLEFYQSTGHDVFIHEILSWLAIHQPRTGTSQ